MTDTEPGEEVAHLFPRLPGRGRLEFKDVISQAAHEICRRALLRLEKVHGVAAVQENGGLMGVRTKGREGGKKGLRRGGRSG
jgi:hypothetical protein